MDKIGDWLEKHPVLAVVGVLLIGLGAWLIFNSNSSSGAPIAQASDSALQQAALAYQEQQNAASAQANAQTSQQNFQLAAQAGSFAGQLALAQEQDQAALVAQNTASQAATTANQNQTTIDLSGISAQLAALENTNSSNVQVQQIIANEGVSIAGINADVAKTQSNNYTQLGVVQANDWTKVQTTIANNQATSSLVGGLFGFLGGFL